MAHPFATVVRAALCVALLIGSLPAVATPISIADLFLQPLDVPRATYLPIQLAVGASYQFTSALVGSTTLTGMQILPMLRSNTAAGNVEGAYTVAELAAISASNYGSYFYTLPDAGYSGDLTPSVATATFLASGSYFVRLTGDTNSAFYYVQVGDRFMPLDGGAQPAAPERVLDPPPADVSIVSTGLPDADAQAAVDDAASALGTAGMNVRRAATAAQVLDIVRQAYINNGLNKITLNLVGHGAPGQIEIGDFVIGRDISARNFQALIDQYVSGVTFVSCSTGDGAAGRQMLQDFANSIGYARGWDSPITVSATSFDIDATAISVIRLPEPGSLLLLAVGLLLLCGLQRLRRQHARPSLLDPLR